MELCSEKRGIKNKNIKRITKGQRIFYIFAPIQEEKKKKTATAGAQFERKTAVKKIQNSPPGFSQMKI